jgi:hypothetical protein
VELFNKNTGLKAFRPYILCYALLFFSCGIENYVYLEPVEYVALQGSTSAVITLPSNSSPEFRYYAIFYRIYISDQSIDSITTSGQRSAINSALASHYNRIDPYTINDNISPSSVGTVLTSLKYYPIHVEVNSMGVPTIVSMDQILQSSSPGTFDIVFANIGPYLQINSSSPSGELPLRRSANGFTASPNRTFLNSTGSGSLTDESRISDNSNTDVERNPTSSGQYTYASLYIAATGIDSNFSVVYSRPKHIGVFRLPSS